jgi:hypothetical protein
MVKNPYHCDPWGFLPRWVSNLNYIFNSAKIVLYFFYGSWYKPEAASTRGTISQSHHVMLRYSSETTIFCWFMCICQSLWPLCLSHLFILLHICFMKFTFSFPRKKVFSSRCYITAYLEKKSCPSQNLHPLNIRNMDGRT